MGRQGAAPDAVTGDSIVTLVFRLAHAVRREFGAVMAGEAWAAEANLRPGCYGVLRTVQSADRHRSQREIAALMHIAPSEVVDLVDRLESAGYLERRRADDDRRRNVLAVTATGEEALERFAAVAHAVDAEVLGALDDGERSTLRALLVKALATDTSP